MERLTDKMMVELAFYWGEPPKDHFAPQAFLLYVPTEDRRYVTRCGEWTSEEMRYVFQPLFLMNPKDRQGYRKEDGHDPVDMLAESLLKMTGGLYRNMFRDGTGTLAAIGVPLHVRMSVQERGGDARILAERVWVHGRDVLYKNVTAWVPGHSVSA